MVRQKNTISFGDAALASRSRRAQSPSSGSRRSNRGRSVRSSRDERSIDDPSLTDEQFFKMMREEIPASSPQPQFRAFAGGEARRGDSGRDRGRDKSQGAFAMAFGRKRSEGAADDSMRAEATPSARERRRRERNEARADRMYARQYATEDSGAVEAEGAPRAAVYEGRVGASQRRAARMQKASQAGPVSAKINPAGWFTGANVSKRTLRSVTAVLCLVLTCAFLYSPAQQYYQSIREHDRLAAEYEYIEQRNAVIASQNAALASDAGMEDAVRQKYGYVVEGDETAIVTGLSDSATDTSRGMSNVEANVLSSAVKAPEEWYTPYLDAFFGVS